MKAGVRMPSGEAEKNSRQAVILEIIAQRNVETQEQLIQGLRERGIVCAQATISRDIKQLHLIKEPAGQGVYRYARAAVPQRPEAADKLRDLFRQSVTAVDYAQNLVVIKTIPGTAGAACSALDHMNLPSLLASLAGDDTALLVARDTESAAALCGELRGML